MSRLEGLNRMASRSGLAAAVIVVLSWIGVVQSAIGLLIGVVMLAVSTRFGTPPLFTVVLALFMIAAVASALWHYSAIRLARVWQAEWARRHLWAAVTTAMLCAAGLVVSAFVFSETGGQPPIRAMAGVSACVGVVAWTMFVRWRLCPPRGVAGDTDDAGTDAGSHGTGRTAG